MSKIRGIRETYTVHTLTICSFLRIRCWKKIIPCVRSLVGFSLQSRRWLRRHVKQSVQKFLKNANFLLRRHVGWSRSPRCMHTLGCLWCLQSDTTSSNTSKDLSFQILVNIEN